MSNTIGYILTESSCESESNIIGDRGDRIYAEGILQDLGTVNRNHRIYLREDIEPDLMGERIQKELIPTGNFVGEVGHPLDKSLARQQTVLIDRAGVLFTKVWIDGNIVKGHFCGEYNNYGDYFNRKLAAGYKPSFSLRALGSIEQKDGKSYVKNIRVISYDWVILPSHRKAYCQKLIDPSTAAEEAKNEALAPEGFYDDITVCTEQTIPILSSQKLDFIKTESANIHSLLENFDLSYNTAQLINEGTAVALTDTYGSTFVVGVEDYVRRQYMSDL